jgi:hypothetical protein
MTIRFNEELLLWTFATLQPASIGDVLLFIGEMYPDVRPLPQVKDLEPLIQAWRDQGDIVRVHGKSRLFSVTTSGNERLSISLRKYRDRVRLFLLKSARDASLRASEGVRKGLAGASPAVNSSSDIQEGTRPIDSAGVPRGPRTTGRVYWPRVVKQPGFKVGSEPRSPDTFLEYYSFPTLAMIHQASANPAEHGDLSITDLGITLGISPRLLTSFIHKPTKHYRQFEIGKRGGGNRLISSPKAFLKVVQYWLHDYFLCRLPVHENCHSYRKERSILTNALPHVAHAYVANIDIENFFGSIDADMVREMLHQSDFGRQFSNAIARLVTLSNGLPQGAPTSPVISNSYLFDFDGAMTLFSEERSLVYTRYADDITISGEDRETIIEAVKYAEERLRTLGLRLNEKKSRIASRGGQQRVTGVVVNTKPQPPRKLRRQVRAMFHQAELHPEQFVGRERELQGYLSYLHSYPVLTGTQELDRYKTILDKLKQ